MVGSLVVVGSVIAVGGCRGGGGGGGDGFGLGVEVVVALLLFVGSVVVYNVSGVVIVNKEYSGLSAKYYF